MYIHTQIYIYAGIYIYTYIFINIYIKLPSVRYEDENNILLIS